ncbi:MAG: AraC family transcriptional regulator, partial [Acidiferrobacterales bacterium]
MALLIWKALESYGCDARPLFEQADLDPEKLRDANARYPVTAMTRLWKLAGEISQDPSFGLTAARFWHPTTFHALGYSWLASETLRDAFDRLVRYCRILSSAAAVRLEESAEDFRLILGTTEPQLRPADEAIDAGLATIIGMCRMTYGSDFNPLRVTMRRDPPANRAAFAQVFRAPIQFSASENILFLGKVELSTPLPTANAELARTNDRVITEYLARFDRGTIKMQVEVKLLEQLSSGHASQESIAAALNLSTRSLQRKLKEEGTTYKQLLELTRRELAAQYVKQPDLSINEITFLLGFSEPANFSRAFKRWTGVSPS